ncbi:MAG: hypothetical protein CPDRYMAC_1720, partial [uncultured Paraburkholderia sp.]
MTSANAIWLVRANFARPYLVLSPSSALTKNYVMVPMTMLGAGFSHRFAFQRQLVGMLYEAVGNRVGGCRVLQPGMPVFE